MLRIDLDAPALAHTRFAVSPVIVTVHAAVLLSGGAGSAGGGWRARIRDTVRDRRLGAVGALFGGGGQYVPDFLTPEPAGPEPAADTELHAVAAVGAERLAFELRLMADGVPREGLAGRRLPTAVLELAQQGERAAAERLAAELEQLWRFAIAPRWPELRARLEADINARAAHTARHGLAASLAGLHPTTALSTAGELRVASRLTGRIPAEGGLTLIPSIFADRIRIVADSVPGPDRRRPMVAYPALPESGERPVRVVERQPVSALLGSTRARILADLRLPSTTSELGVRLGLAPSTVSHHLGVLHRSDLATRVRQGQEVRYQLSPRGAALLARSGAAG